MGSTPSIWSLLLCVPPLPSRFSSPHLLPCLHPRPSAFIRGPHAFRFPLREPPFKDLRPGSSTAGGEDSPGWVRSVRLYRSYRTEWQGFAIKKNLLPCTALPIMNEVGKADVARMLTNPCSRIGPGKCVLEERERPSFPARHQSFVSRLARNLGSERVSRRSHCLYEATTVALHNRIG